MSLLQLERCFGGKNLIHGVLLKSLVWMNIIVLTLLSNLGFHCLFLTVVLSNCGLFMFSYTHTFPTLAPLFMNVVNTRSTNN